MYVCPFCKCDPYEYVHNGLGYERVAVTCCDLGYELLGMRKSSKKALQTLRQMRSHSPRQKARAMRTLREYGLRKERRTSHEQ